MVNAMGSATDLTGAISQSKNRASVSREQFLKILVTELTSQNPMDPLDNSQFLDQLVSLQSLEQTAAMTDSFRTFEHFIQMSSASSLIGKKVKGVDDKGATVQGVVTKVVLDKDSVQLVVGTKKVPVNSVQEITPGTV
jgi:flagellar basal-body rod modification protein FlgD